MPFGADDGGNLYLTDAVDAPDGRVWFWDHELAFEGEKPVLVADSLAAFLADLKPAAA